MIWLVAAGPALGQEGREGMAGHFEQGALIMLAVAVNDLEESRSRAGELAKNKEAPEPLRAAAKDVSKAKTVKKAAPATADLARTCAECHVSGGRGPLPQNTEAVGGKTPVDKHIMASMFIWIGLVTPLEQPYDLGLSELLPPLTATSDDDVLELGQEFAEWVSEAQSTPSWDLRADVFANMLETCAECHRTAGIGG